jgi:hypothetical protein
MKRLRRRRDLEAEGDTMTRRVRAALQLAYECVRTTRVNFAELDRAVDAIAIARTDSMRTLAGAVEHMSSTTRVAWGTSDGGLIRLRLLRARLALLLRVLLRVDAGDFGPATCEACGEPGVCPEITWCGSRVIANEGRPTRALRRYTALWEQAGRAR